MTLNPDELEVGDVVYMTRRYGVGNTTMTHVNIYDVEIKALTHVGGQLISAVVVWNSGMNREEYRYHQLARLIAYHPKPKRHPWPSPGEAKRHEQAVIDAAEQAKKERQKWRDRRKAKRLAAKAGAR